jgi:hypothetical protein
MKHFMCVHHWNNEETKSRVKEMLDEHPHTDRQFLGFYDGEKAKALQHWGGEGDFFTVTGLLKVKMICKKHLKPLV